jgi:hypothetical protein
MVPQWAKSAFSGQKDEALKGWIERRNALNEIKDTRGYQLIDSQISRELDWATKELVHASPLEVVQLQSYIKALNVVKNFILTTNKNAEVAAEVLQDRPKQMDLDAYHDLVFRNQQ